MKGGERELPKLIWQLWCGHSDTGNSLHFHHYGLGDDDDDDGDDDDDDDDQHHHMMVMTMS